MKELRRQNKELNEHWKIAYKTALANPTAWKPHLPNSSITIIDETVRTVDIWLNRSRAPSGFSPGYHLAKSMAAVFLPQLLTTVQNLEAGQYNHFPNFINGLTNLLSALHTMAVYSEKGDIAQTNADMSAELAQALALLSTAQTELAQKKQLLDSVEALAAEIEEKHAEIIRLEEESSTNANAITNSSKSATDTVQEIEALLETAKSHEADLTEILSNNKKLNTKLTLMTEQLSKLQDRCREQEKIIDSILPRAASAGLADAFSQRGKQLELGKWIWMSAFVMSLIGLSTFAWHLINVPPGDPKDFWLHVLVRIPLAAPLVWLGWFSAIQYGNTIRVQEDYAFKEATSKAFQGYRNHMEHLANIDIDGANTALNLLSAKTIEILGHEPLRIFGKTESDATPTGGLANIFNLRKTRSDDKAANKITGD